MSHFVVMVIGEDPEEQLAPYDENMDIPEYCKGDVSMDDKYSFMRIYKEDHPEDGILTPDEFYDKYYPKHGKDWDGNNCKKNEDGVWKEYSTYNPNSKWDWYTLGGRWSGLINLKEGATGVSGEPGAFGNEVGIDQARLGDIENLKELIPFALVKDGVWYERGEMGWWGATSNEKDRGEWEEEVLKHLNDLPKDTLISMYDCHI